MSLSLHAEEAGRRSRGGGGERGGGWGRGGGTRGRERRPVGSAETTPRGRTRAPGSGSYCTEGGAAAGGGRGSVVPAHGQVHEGEHVELSHDGEAQEHAV